jgi:hypothetical protein
MDDEQVRQVRMQKWLRSEQVKLNDEHVRQVSIQKRLRGEQVRQDSKLKSRRGLAASRKCMRASRRGWRLERTGEAGTDTVGAKSI